MSVNKKYIYIYMCFDMRTAQHIATDCILLTPWCASLSHYSLEVLHRDNPKPFWEQKQPNEQEGRKGEQASSSSSSSAAPTEGLTPKVDDITGEPPKTLDTGSGPKWSDGSSTELRVEKELEGITSAGDFEGPLVLDDNADYAEIDTLTDAAPSRQDEWIVLQRTNERDQGQLAIGQQGDVLCLGASYDLSVYKFVPFLLDTSPFRMYFSTIHSS